MNKSQLEKEIKTRTEILKDYLGKVQQIQNSRYDIECQTYFTTVNNIIRKMNKIWANLSSYSEAEFANLNFKQIIADLDNMMIEPKMTYDHIKSRGFLPAPPRTY